MLARAGTFTVAVGPGVNAMLHRRMMRYWLACRYAVHARKPRLMARMAANSVRVFALREPLLRYVDFSIDFACNLNCKHCFNETLRSPEPNRNRLSPGDYGRIAAECRLLGAVAFSFQGGEATLNLDRLEDILQAVDPWSALISLTTNGTLLTDGNLSRLWRAGVDILTVSLDSGIADEHDAFRGRKGTFDLALAGIDRALAMGFRVTIGTTVSHGSVRSEGLRATMNLARQRRCLMVLALAVPAGRWADNDEILLTQEDLKLVDSYVASDPLIRTDLEGNYLRRGCGAAKEILYVTPYGDVFACPFLHISFGRVTEESVGEIRQRALRTPYLAGYWPRCLVAADPRFLQDVMVQVRAADHAPLRYEQVHWGDPKSNR